MPGQDPDPTPDVDGNLGGEGRIVGHLSPLDNLANHVHLRLLMISLIGGDIIFVIHVKLRERRNIEREWTNRKVREGPSCHAIMDRKWCNFA